MLAAHGPAGRHVVHQRGAHLCRSERLNGTAAGVGEALSPLIGVWAPTFSACELAAVFLLPFVAIRLVAGDRQSGAFKLEMQQAMSRSRACRAKALVLLAGWLIAMLPPLSAILLWELRRQRLPAGAGHGRARPRAQRRPDDRAGAPPRRRVTEHPSTAAILTLSVTVGTWILNFVAAIQGGLWERAAGYTPAAMVARVPARPGAAGRRAGRAGADLRGLGARRRSGCGSASPVRRRVYESVAVGALRPPALFACTFVTASWDTSESRANSFPEADEEALAQHSRRRCGSKRTWRRKIRGASIWSIARSSKLRRVMPR